MKRLSLFISILCVFSLLGACNLLQSDEEALKDGMRANLDDPKSVKFGAIKFSAKKTRACIQVATKDSAGKYGELRFMYAIKLKDGTWYPADPSLGGDFCLVILVSVDS